jgi:hypothetical protein
MSRHEPKVCVICHCTFTPSDSCSPGKAAKQEVCGYACSWRRRRAKFRGQQGSADGRAIAAHDLCRCSTCAPHRGETQEARAELIARVAAEKGVPVSVGPPPPKLGSAALARRNAIIRRRVEAATP